MTTSNLDLEAMAKLLRVRIKVVLQEELLQMLPEPGQNLIVNWGNEQNGGTHWVAIVIADDGDEAVFIDSFGTHYSSAVDHFMKRTPGSVTKLGFSNIITQDLASNLCGWYCLACITFCDTTKNAAILRHMLSGQLRGAVLPAKLRAALYEKITYP
jgi:hypothetical protein